jgi:hypothetical protein
VWCPFTSLPFFLCLKKRFGQTGDLRPRIADAGDREGIKGNKPQTSQTETDSEGDELRSKAPVSGKYF